MMQMRDWISGLVGIVVAVIGLSSFVEQLGFLSFLSDPVVRWLTIIAGVYLTINSLTEITNSNIIGWWSMAIALICIVVGLLPTIFDMEPFARSVYATMLVVEGILLMIATFAMEL
jgi:hypothetical protein